MARVNLDSYAFDDPRFDLLAAAVRHFRDRWHALGYVARVWHACASRSVKQVRAVELAGLLGYRRPLAHHEDAAAAFCDAAGLGERMPDGMIRIRGTDGRTDYLDDDGDELVERIRAHVTESGPARRADILRALELQRSQRASFYAKVKQAIQSGQLIESDGMVAAPRDLDGGVQRLVSSTSSKTSKTRPLVLAPAPDLVPEKNKTHTARTQASVQQTSSKTDLDVQPRHGSGHAVVQGASSLDEHGQDTSCIEQQATHGKNLYTRLYEYRHEVARRYAAAKNFVRDIGAIGETSLVQRALWSEVLVVAGPDGKRGVRDEKEIRHALDMIGAQADEKAKAGEDPTYSLLANAWSPEVLLRALGCPDEKTARHRAVRRSHSSSPRQVALPTSQPPASQEDFVREAARKKAEKEAQRAAADQAR